MNIIVIEDSDYCVYKPEINETVTVESIVWEARNNYCIDSFRYNETVLLIDRLRRDSDCWIDSLRSEK